MKKLGVFDSGIGGFNVVKELQDKLSLNIVFLADHKNLPYGNKSEKALKKILAHNIQWFIDQGIDHVLLACNTASTFVDYLREQFPEIRIDSIIEITAEHYRDLDDVLVFGTQRTTDAKGYDKYLTEPAQYHALPELASLVEENNEKVIRRYLRSQLRGVKNKNYILGCTHYSIVAEVFKRYLKGNIVDAIEPVLKYYQDFEGDYQLSVYSTASIRRLELLLSSIYQIKTPVKFYQDDFKMVVVSDNHGKIEVIEEIVELHRDAAAFFHCGDTEISPDYLKDFYTVKGNNDYFYDYPDNLTLDRLGFRFYLAHSHEYLFEDRVEALYQKGLRHHYQFIFYGHTHRFSYEYKNGIHILNPGSLSYNRDGSQPSYAIIKVIDNEIQVERVNFGG